MNKEGKGIMIGAAVGIIAGAVAGILLAPKSGKELRGDISKYAMDMKDKIADELVKMGTMTKDKYDAAVKKIVAVYETEKKISAADAKKVKKMLVDNYEEVEKAAKKATK